MSKKIEDMLMFRSVTAFEVNVSDLPREYSKFRRMLEEEEEKVPEELRKGLLIQYEGDQNDGMVLHVYYREKETPEDRRKGLLRRIELAKRDLDRFQGFLNELDSATSVDAAPSPNQKDWVEDFQDEKGDSSNKCMFCHSAFRGHVRRDFCKECFTKNQETA
jgi:hypothetical protein